MKRFSCVRSLAVSTVWEMRSRARRKRGSFRESILWCDGCGDVGCLAGAGRAFLCVGGDYDIVGPFWLWVCLSNWFGGSLVSSGLEWCWRSWMPSSRLLWPACV